MLVWMSILLILNNFTRTSCNEYCLLPCQGEKNTGCICVLGKECPEYFEVLRTTESEKMEILEAHNFFRQKVASGREPRLENTPASNMMVLNYEVNLEHLAMCWAMQCEPGFDVCRRTQKFEHVGQINDIVHKNCKEVNFFQNVIDEWYKQIEVANIFCVKKYFGCGNKFPQIIWAETQFVGCARIQIFDMCSVVCNYAPMGNIITYPIYKVGDGASKCPEFAEPNSRYNALCGTQNDLTVRSSGHVNKISFSFLFFLLFSLLCSFKAI